MDEERSFGEIHFGAAELGNRARTRRLATLATQLAQHPGGTLPHKLRSPAALRAAYRLMNREEVTHRTVLASHREETLRRIADHGTDAQGTQRLSRADSRPFRSLHHVGPVREKPAETRRK